MAGRRRAGWRGGGGGGGNGVACGGGRARCARERLRGAAVRATGRGREAGAKGAGFGPELRRGTGAIREHIVRAGGADSAQSGGGPASVIVQL